jgi:hypothetical protein
LEGEQEIEIATARETGITPERTFLVSIEELVHALFGTLASEFPG